MEIDSGTAANAASAVLSLSKIVWKLGVSLAKFDQENKIAGKTIKGLIEEVKLLGHECDLVYADLGGVAASTETSPRPHNVDGRIWECLAAQVEGIGQTMHELDSFMQTLRCSDTSFDAQEQTQRELDRSTNRISNIRAKVWRHTENLHLTALLINIVSGYIVPRRADHGLTKELERLRDVLQKMEAGAETSRQSQLTQIEVALLQYGNEVLSTGLSICEKSPATKLVASGPEVAISETRITDWMNALDSIHRQDQLPDPSDEVSNFSSVFSVHDAHTNFTSATSECQTSQENTAIKLPGNDFEDDLNTDLVKAALETGAQAFEARDWQEAESLLREALRVLHQLPSEKQSFCDFFDLQYKLATCAYYTQDSAHAEDSLTSLVQQSVISDHQQACIYDAMHLLTMLYVRMGQLHRAQTECEKTLVARRRLLGKHSDASMKSTALMSHIYVLLNNRARAKMCITMIPEAQRVAVLRTVEESLGTTVDYLNSPAISDSPQPTSADIDLAVKRTESIMSTSSLALSMDNRCYGPVSTHIAQSPIREVRRRPCREMPLNVAESEDLQSVTMTSISSVDEPNTLARAVATVDHSSDPQVLRTTAADSGELSSPVMSPNSRGRTLSRKEILDRIGCQPRDSMEEAVCNSDHQAFTTLLHKEKGFFRSKLRKRVRPERVTALHFAALFGEIDMARRLISSNFNINEIPFGYSTSLTPLKFAIGARQVDMVEFLITYGAKPADPDTWSTLAGQLMNRSWLRKTMSESEKDFIPVQIVAIMKILLKHGWNINAPIEKAGVTVLHQAVTFWTDSYRWDRNLRTVVTSFLCERGADVFRTNLEGKTPYDMAVASGHQDLLHILDRSARSGKIALAEPVELST